MSNRSTLLTAMIGTRSLKQATKMLKIPETVFKQLLTDYPTYVLLTPTEVAAIAKYFKGDARAILHAQADDQLLAIGEAVPVPATAAPAEVKKESTVKKVTRKVKEALSQAPRSTTTVPVPTSTSPSNGKSAAVRFSID